MNTELVLFSRQHFPMGLSTAFLYLVTLWVYLVSTFTAVSSEALAVSPPPQEKLSFSLKLNKVKFLR